MAQQHPVIMVVPSVGMAMSRPGGIWRLARPPGWFLGLTSKLWLVGVVYYTSNVAISDRTKLLLVATLALLVTIWLLKAVVHSAGTLFGRLGPYSMGRYRFLGLPVIVAIGVALFVYRPALRGRLLWSEASLRTFIEMDAADFAEEDRSGWVGLFHVSDVRRSGNTVRFQTVEGSDFRAGLIYSPDHRPSIPSTERIALIYDPWWSWQLGITKE